MCETEKPKRVGCVANSCLMRVDLPVPEGPEKTMGRDGVEDGVGGMAGEGKWWRTGLMLTFWRRGTAVGMGRYEQQTGCLQSISFGNYRSEMSERDRFRQVFEKLGASWS